MSWRKRPSPTAPLPGFQLRHHAILSVGMKRIPIAVDVHIPRASYILFWMNGFDVVVQAEHGESDEDWLWRAMQAGAKVVVTPDKELLYIAACCGLETVRLNSVVSGQGLCHDVLSRLKKLRPMFPS
jgi:hypothetical protein